MKVTKNLYSKPFLQIKLARSRFGRTPKQVACLKALGLSKIGQVVCRENRSEILGLIKVVGFLLHIVEVDKCN